MSENGTNPDKMKGNDTEEHDNGTLQADLEMDPGRELKAAEGDLTAGFTLKAGDLKTQEDVDEAAKKLLEKKTKEKKTTPKTVKKTRKPKKPKTVTVKYTGLLPMGTERPLRLWRRGDTAKVSPEIADELIKYHSSFSIVRRRKR